MFNTHPATRAATSGEVAVGIDDFLPSRVALNRAAEFARSAGDRLRMIHVFLVVGTREHVGLERLVTGSVSHYRLSHAECPVAAVPPSTGPETTRQSSPVAAGQPAGAR
jgi:nucleotide-binding universal stress UspA family protein